MKKILLIIAFLFIYINMFSQIIVDQYIYPVPRIVDSTYLVTTCNFANNVKSIDSLIIKKDTIDFLPNSYSISIYSYYNCEGWATPSTLIDTFNLSSYIDVTGLYKIKFYTYCTSSPNNIVDSTIQNINVISSTQKILINESLLNIFPNPINTNSTIYCSDIITYIEIYDIRGVLLSKKNINKELYKLNMANYKKGMYYIRIKTNKKIIRKKILVE